MDSNDRFGLRPLYVRRPSTDDYLGRIISNNRSVKLKFKCKSKSNWPSVVEEDILSESDKAG